MTQWKVTPTDRKHSTSSPTTTTENSPVIFDPNNPDNVYLKAMIEALEEAWEKRRAQEADKAQKPK
jgi:hypothetical protein